MARKKTSKNAKITDLVSSAIEDAINLDIPLLLVGEAGVGKNYVISQYAKQHNKNLVRVSLTGDADSEDIIGRIGLVNGETVWVDGVLTAAIRRGDWVVLDEVNAALPSVLFALHSLLDDDKSLTLLNHPQGEVVKKHPESRIFATANPISYMGTRMSNLAFLSRFSLSVEMPKPTKDMAVNIILNHVHSKAAALAAVEVYEKFPKHVPPTSGVIFTLREAITLARLIEKGERLPIEKVLGGKVALVENQNVKEAVEALKQETLSKIKEGVLAKITKEAKEAAEE